MVDTTRANHLGIDDSLSGGQLPCGSSGDPVRLLVGGDPVFMLEREPDVVQPMKQAMPSERFDVKLQ
jgi:hypothetical protein